MYSTALYIANTALVASGFTAIPTAAAFATGLGTFPGGTLDKYQGLAVSGLNLFQHALGIVMNKRFMWREFRITTAAGVAQYVVNCQIVEGFRANSFFNVTVGGAGNQIHVVTYQWYQERYARPDVIPTGNPLFLVMLPDIGGPPQLQVLPTPDQTYVISGQSRLMVPNLVDGNSLVIFPDQYEHALIFKLMEFIEGKTSEGTQASARMYAEQFIAEVMRDAGGADEEQEQWDTGVRLFSNYSRQSARDYNPNTDTAGPYP